MASEREPFGQLLIEGMACGLPAVAAHSLGPASIIEDGRTGWLVNSPDESGLAEALAAVMEDRVSVSGAVARHGRSCVSVSRGRGSPRNSSPCSRKWSPGRVTPVLWRREPLPSSVHRRAGGGQRSRAAGS